MMRFFVQIPPSLSRVDVRTVRQRPYSWALRSADSRYDGTPRDSAELPEDSAIRLYLADTGLDVCYDGFCAAGNQFPALITKTRSAGPSVDEASWVVVYFALSEHHSSTYHYERRPRRPIMNQRPYPSIPNSAAFRRTPLDFRYIATYTSRIIIRSVCFGLCSLEFRLFRVAIVGFCVNKTSQNTVIKLCTTVTFWTTKNP